MLRFKNFRQMRGVIADNIPAFTISDSALRLEDPTEKGFIYKTDTVLLAFDSQEIYTQREIEKEMSSPVLILSLVFFKGCLHPLRSRRPIPVALRTG
jgi:hypothetical protein